MEQPKTKYEVEFSESYDVVSGIHGIPPICQLVLVIVVHVVAQDVQQAIVAAKAIREKRGYSENSQVSAVKAIVAHLHPDSQV